MGRTRYYIYDPSIPHFHTCTVVGWMPIFTRPETTQIILDAFCYMQTHHNVVLHAYVILENHLHFIAKAEPAIIQRFKSYTARKIIDYLTVKKVNLILQQLTFYKAHHKTESDYQLWQEGTHPQQIQNVEMMRQKIDYIHYNPVKRGYVDKPVHWRYSSARNYAGGQGMIEITRNW